MIVMWMFTRLSRFVFTNKLSASKLLCSVLAACSGTTSLSDIQDSDNDGAMDSVDAYPQDKHCQQLKEVNGVNCYWTLVEQQSAPLFYVHRQNTAFIYLPLSYYFLRVVTISS